MGIEIIKPIKRQTTEEILNKFSLSVIYYLLKSFQTTGIAITQAITMKIHQYQVSIQVANSTPMPIPPKTLAVIYSSA
jgi:hypothetical protein